MSWQILTLIGVITFSISTLLQRLLLHKDKGDPVAYTILFQGLVAVIIGVFALINGFVMPDLIRLWFPIALTVVLYGCCHLLFAKALQLLEASVFSVVIATNAFWTMLVGIIVLNEHLSVAEVAGALLIFAAVGILVEHKHPRHIDKGILLGLLAALLFGLASGAWAYVGKSSDAASWAALSFLGPALFVLAIRPSAALKLRPFLTGNTLKRLLLLGAFYSISAVCMMRAYQIGDVSLVAPLQQTSLIVTVILAIIFLHERDRFWQKILATATCFVGVLLLV